MALKQEVVNDIVEYITDLRKGNELEDFTVIVDGVSVKCHRFILGACSLFFRALFRSGMKENKENCVILKSVSHPTFTLILSAVYTGHDILSEENVFKVWRATHMLQIGFLVKECEVFLKQNISAKNYEEIYENAKLLDSNLLEDVHNFMLKNFDIICTSQTFLELPVSEIKALIDSDELVVSSEDNVVKAVMRWISYVSTKTFDIDEIKQGFCKELPFYNDNGESGNDRQEHLLTLFSAVRSCFLSPDYWKILSNPSIINNVGDEALLKSVYFQLRIGRRHGQWPSRCCSSLQNVVVCAHRSHFRQRDQTVWAEEIASEAYSYTANFKSVTGNFVNFDNELYELTDNGLQVFRDGDWKFVLEWNFSSFNSLSSNTIMTAVEDSIFFFSENKVQSVNPKCRTPQLNDHRVVPGASSMTAVTSFNDLILVFGSHTREQSDEETTVHTFDPSNETWKKLDNIGGPAKDLISFHTDNKTFLLQTNGSCWNVTMDGNGSVIITFNGKAWDFHWDLYGAAIFRNHLLIFGGMQAKGKSRSITCFSGEVLKLWSIFLNSRASVTPIIMDKKYFTDKKSWP